MSFTSVPVTANDRNKSECGFSYTEMLYVETVTKITQNVSIYKSYGFYEFVYWYILIS